MRIEKKARATERELRYLMHETNGWDRTFEFEGHTYVLIAKGNSQHTELTYSNGFLPVFNLKSRTIRALEDTTLVTPRDCTVYSEQFYDV